MNSFSLQAFLLSLALLVAADKYETSPGLRGVDVASEDLHVFFEDDEKSSAHGDVDSAKDKSAGTKQSAVEDRRNSEGRKQDNSAGTKQTGQVTKKHEKAAVEDGRKSEEEVASKGGIDVASEDVSDAGKRDGSGVKKHREGLGAECLEREKEERKKMEEEGLVEEITSADITAACMLIGGVSFIMVLFSLVNYEDDDIRRYAWSLVSLVGAIFVGVMVFEAVNQWVLACANMYEISDVQLCAVQYGHLFTWVLLLQLVLGISSGSIGEGVNHDLMVEHWVMADALRADCGKFVYNFKGEYDESVVQNRSGTKSVVKLVGIEVPVEKKKVLLEHRKRRMKCWGTLLAHMCGFSAINAGGTMQHLEMFAASPYMSLVPLFLNQLFVNILFATFNTMRDLQKERLHKFGHHGVRAELFDEYATEAENDISCMAGSFLLVQSIRYVQAGALPSLEGELEEASWNCVYALFGTGVGLMCVSVILIVVHSRLTLDDQSAISRFFRICAGMSGMGFAWCFLFGSQSVFFKTPFLDANGVGMVTISGRVLLALILSLVSAASIFGLDIINDIAKHVSPAGKTHCGYEIIGQLVFAKSLLIGFSWEHSFDGGVAVIAHKTAYPLSTQSVLAVFMFLIVVPAWRRHILRKALVLQDYEAKQYQAEIDRAGGYGPVPSSPRDTSCVMVSGLTSSVLSPRSLDPSSGAPLRWPLESKMSSLR